MSNDVEMMGGPNRVRADEKKAPGSIAETVPEDLKQGEVKNLDKAEQFLQEHNFSHAFLTESLQDEAAMKKLRKRLDWFLMPLLCGTYLLQYIDKQALSYSAVFDLFETTGTTQSQYSWLASIFYFGEHLSECCVSAAKAEKSQDTSFSNGQPPTSPSIFRQARSSRPSLSPGDAS